MKMAFTAVAGMGDIFTDAHECAASVHAAQNVAVLAGKFSGHGIVATKGHLFADGKAVCYVDVLIGGQLVFEVPEGFDTSGRNWEITLTTGQALPVLMFTGESGDDESWVIEDAETFYAALLADTEPSA
jgi:hypothetical protein